MHCSCKSEDRFSALAGIRSSYFNWQHQVLFLFINLVLVKTLGPYIFTHRSFIFSIQIINRKDLYILWWSSATNEETDTNSECIKFAWNYTSLCCLFPTNIFKLNFFTSWIISWKFESTVVWIVMFPLILFFYTFIIPFYLYDIDSELVIFFLDIKLF